MFLQLSSVFGRVRAQFRYFIHEWATIVYLGNHVLLKIKENTRLRRCVEQAAVAVLLE